MKTYQCLNCGKDCPSFRSKKNRYCDNKCQADFQYKTYIKEWKLGVRSGIKGRDGLSSHIKRYLFEKYQNKCCGCGLDSWRGEKITLEVEHSDGNSSNQSENNLLLLCPNCHSQTPTYRSKNRGMGRHSRRQRYKEGKSS